MSSESLEDRNRARREGKTWKEDLPVAVGSERDERQERAEFVASETLFVLKRVLAVQERIAKSLETLCRSKVGYL